MNNYSSRNEDAYFNKLLNNFLDESETNINDVVTLSELEINYNNEYYLLDIKIYIVDNELSDYEVNSIFKIDYSNDLEIELPVYDCLLIKKLIDCNSMYILNKAFDYINL